MISSPGRAGAPVVMLTVALAAALMFPCPSSGQQLPPEFSSDSTAWQRVLIHVVESLSGMIVRGAVDPSPQPWQIRLPPNEPQRQLLETQTRTIFRARPVTEGDTVAYTLELGQLHVVHDTAYVTVRSEVTQHCAGATIVAGYVNIDSVFVPRAPQGFWGIARSAGVKHGDRIPCPRSKR